eukprot:scaffold40029_cov58-Attheya_sp.AAC.4
MLVDNDDGHRETCDVVDTKQTPIAASMTSVSSEISCIEEVEAQTYGSSLLARGGFGEVSIALHRGNNGSGTSEVVQLAA